MADRISPGPISCQNNCSNLNNAPREAVSIHTTKVYDSCRSKECIQDIRVYPTRCSQEILDRAISVKCKNAELLWVFIDVEPITFNKGFYTVDVKYFYKVTVDAFTGIGRPREVCGLCAFDKRTILCGGEGSARIFSSKYVAGDFDIQKHETSNLPTAVVEVVDPLCLDAKIVEKCHRHHNGCDLSEVPEYICSSFDDDIVLSSEGKQLFVTLGQFSIIRLERDCQLVIPAFDICVPQKECVPTGIQDACEIFETVAFPIDEFCPPDCKVYDNNCKKKC